LIAGARPLALVLLVFGSGRAWAGEDSDALAKFGLIGSWAVDCHAPPSFTNPFQTFVPSNYGEPTRQLLVGNPEFDGITTIYGVFRITDDRLRLSFEQNGIAVTVLLVKDKDRIRPLESTTGDGHTVVSGGIVQRNGQETTWLQKCQG